MITIKDNDPPIKVAQKLIYGTKEKEVSVPFGKSFPDMYDIFELKEIAQYLLLYCHIHEDRD